MQLDKERYADLVKSHAPKSPCVKNCLCAFVFGGFICTLGELFFNIYTGYLSLSEKDASAWASITLVFLAALLTGLGVFDNIAKIAGAGTLVPITGFANAVVSPAIDTKAEGYVLGVGAKIFTVAGPVLLYGTLAGVLWGVIYFICGMTLGA